MSESIADLISKLELDAWRKTVGFTPEIETAHDVLLDQNSSETDCIHVLSDWLQKYQPCLFGRIAAKLGLLSYCILSESDLRGPDEAIMEKVQSCRTQWTREGYEGEKSGFVILAISTTIAHALPDQIMKKLAARLCSLYLQTDIFPDEIYLDDIFLEKPGKRRTTWKWNAGVNYFCSQGDKRWWQDHRIPGGMAFSMNSVGHMVKSGMLANLMNQLEEIMEAPEEGWISTKIDSLEKALEVAMRTINLASEAVSGKATRLLPLPNDPSLLPVQKCPVSLPHFLADKDFCHYEGLYHTDYTLPSDYFLPDVERPDDLLVHKLDFTYLFDNSLDNPDYIKLGVGRPVRGEKDSAYKVPAEAIRKRLRAAGKTVRISSNKRLVKSLSKDGR